MEGEVTALSEDGGAVQQEHWHLTDDGGAVGTGQALAARKRWAWMRWLWNAQANLERKCSIAVACVVMLLMQVAATLLMGLLRAKMLTVSLRTMCRISIFHTLDFFTVPKQVW